MIIFPNNFLNELFITEISDDNVGLDMILHQPLTHWLLTLVCTLSLDIGQGVTQHCPPGGGQNTYNGSLIEHETLMQLFYITTLVLTHLERQREC